MKKSQIMLTISTLLLILAMGREVIFEAEPQEKKIVDPVDDGTHLEFSLIEKVTATDYDGNEIERYEFTITNENGVEIRVTINDLYQHGLDLSPRKTLLYDHINGVAYDLTTGQKISDLISTDFVRNQKYMFTQNEDGSENLIIYRYQVVTKYDGSNAIYVPSTSVTTGKIEQRHVLSSYIPLHPGLAAEGEYVLTNLESTNPFPDDDWVVLVTFQNVESQEKLSYVYNATSYEFMIYNPYSELRARFWGNDMLVIDKPARGNIITDLYGRILYDTNEIVTILTEDIIILSETPLNEDGGLESFHRFSSLTKDTEKKQLTLSELGKYPYYQVEGGQSYYIQNNFESGANGEIIMFRYTYHQDFANESEFSEGGAFAFAICDVIAFDPRSGDVLNDFNEWQAEISRMQFVVR